MKRIVTEKMRIITPDDEYNYFFAYYDLQPYSSDCKYHLAHRVGFADRLPEPDDTAVLGYIDEDGCFTAFAETGAWNFQQGAQLQWNPQNPSEVIYNVRGGDFRYRTVIHNITTGKKRYTDRAVANVSSCGKWGLGINFSRVYDFRPGYGYAGVPDPFFDNGQPDGDGVFLVDMESGVSQLIIDYRRIAEEFPNAGIGEDKLTVNHITFSPSSERFMFLVRNTPKNGKGWRTLLLTSDRTGNMRRLLDYTFVSHYNWRDDGHLLAYCCVDGINALYLLDDAPDVSAEKSTAARFLSPCFSADLHCIYSPDRRYILGDSYPDREGYRPLYLYDTETAGEKLLLRSYSPNPPVIDIRCDLHARWSGDGRYISFDGLNEGKRCIYEIII
ncbi:MAG: TolB-like translocation protein [Eubacteriales bacterium]